MLGRVSTPDATTHRSLIHHPDFRRLWTGDAFGQLGAQLTALALPIFAVQQLAATEWEMGVLTAAEYAAFLVIGLPAGAWVDRMRKRRVLIVADLVRAAVLGRRRRDRRDRARDDPPADRRRL